MGSNSQNNTTALSPYDSPSNNAAVTRDPVHYYGEVSRTQMVSTNGSSAGAMYSETSTTMVRNPRIHLLAHST